MGSSDAVAPSKFLSLLMVIVANPMRTHAFVKVEMLRNKTDKSDTHRAQVLAALRVIVSILWSKVS